MTDQDRDRFVKLLLIANSKEHFKYRDFQNKSLSDIERGDPLVAIGAYVLMPNHFHLLVKEINPGGTFSRMYLDDPQRCGVAATTLPAKKSE